MVILSIGCWLLAVGYWLLAIGLEIEDTTNSQQLTPNTQAQSK
jgi:hypothetical protein